MNAPAPTHPAPERIDIVCQDGVQLAGHFLPAEGQLRGLPVLLCPATGIKQFFYLRFATWLASQGHDVMVFDYRGVGLSLHGKLRDCKATLAQWGQVDQVAALEWLLQRTGSEKAVILGHSAGGQMIGLMPNHDRVARVVGVSTSTGWFKGMRPWFRLQALFALRFVVPIGISFTGFGLTSMFGLGENLPALVARQWGEWCAAGGYATNAVRGQPEKDFHNDIRIPITVFYAEDDDIANPITVQDLMRTFPNAVKKVIAVRPAQFGLTSLGHIDWFRTTHQTIWPQLAKAVRGETRD